MKSSVAKTVLTEQPIAPLCREACAELDNAILGVGLHRVNVEIRKVAFAQGNEMPACTEIRREFGDCFTIALHLELENGIPAYSDFVWSKHHLVVVDTRPSL